MIFVCGLECMTNPQRVQQYHGCTISTAQTNSHMAFLCHCSLASCCYTAVLRSVISTSMEKHTSCVKFQGSQTSLTLYLRELPWDPTFNSNCVRSVDTATLNCSSEVQVGSASDEMLFVFLLFSVPLFSFMIHWKTSKCSMSAHVPFETQSLFVVCLFYPEHYSKWIFYHVFFFASLSFGRIQK